MTGEVGVCSFENSFILNSLGRSWTMGPVVFEQVPNTDLCNIFVPQSVIERSFMTISDFKNAVMQDLRIPIKISFDVDGDFGPYGFGEFDYDLSFMAWFKGTTFVTEAVKFEFELVAKGKEIDLNGISGKDDEQSRKPLFWASILKGNIH